MLQALGQPASTCIGYNPFPCSRQYVAVKKVAKRRPRGTGRHPLIAVRLPPELIARIDRYAKERGISRSEALRALAVIALRGPNHSLGEALVGLARGRSLLPKCNRSRGRSPPPGKPIEPSLDADAKACLVMS